MSLSRRGRSWARRLFWPYLALLTLALHWPQLRQEDLPDLGWLPFDKAMHFLTFGGLAALMVWSRPWPRRSLGFNTLAAVGLGLAYGAVKETTQPWVGRTRSLADLGFDFLGLWLGAALALAVMWVWRRAAGHSGHGHLSARAAPGGANPGGVTPVSPTPSDTTPGDTTSGGGESFVGHAALVSGLTLVSRLTGLVRDAVLVAVFGAAQYLDAFFIGFLIPNLFRRLFGEGALTAAFIPRYTRLLRDDPALARRFASLCVCLVGLLLTVITLIGEGVLAVVLQQATSEKVALATRLTMLMLPYMPLVCGVAFFGAILQVHRRFGPAAAAPILLNLVMIAAAALVAWGHGGDDAQVNVLAWSVVVAGAVQVGTMGYHVYRLAPLTLDFAGTRKAFTAMLWTMLPMLLGLGVFQINTLLDGLIAYSLAPPEVGPTEAPAKLHLLGYSLDYPVEPGGVTVLNLAQRLYQFPLGVFAIAISTAIFPALARAYSSPPDTPLQKPTVTDRGPSNPATPFAAIFHKGLRLTLFIGLPASVGLMLVRVPLTRVFFEYGAFETADALRAATLVAAYSSAVWAYSMTHVVTRAFYAADDANTPLRVSLAMVALNLSLNLTLVWPLGVAGLAWSTAICAVVQVVWLLVLVRRHVGHVATPQVVRSGWTTAWMSAVMGLAIWLLALPMDLDASSQGWRIVQLAVLVGGGGAVYLGLAWLMHVPEARWALRRGVEQE